MNNTIFHIKDPFNSDFTESIEVEGVGQEAAKAILRAYPNKRVILKGFKNTETNKITFVKF